MSRDRDRASLHPAIVPILLAHQNAAAEDPLCGPPVLIETYRPPDVQALDWAKGRDAAGNVVDKAAVVTHKRPGDSWHQTKRWIRRCPDCAHESGAHQPAHGAILCCAAGGPNLGESCPCAITNIRLDLAEWVQIPAALAYHLALRCRGCHPPGVLVGFGAHGKMTAADFARYTRLASLGQAASPYLRSGMDWDGDRVYLEKGESDLTHYELHPNGAPLSQVLAVLAIRGTHLEEHLHV